MSILILSSHLRLGLPNGLFPSGFPTNTLCTPLSSSIRATCPIHLILLDLTTRTIYVYIYIYIYIQGVRKRLYLFQKFFFLWAPDVILESFIDQKLGNKSKFFSTLQRFN